MVSVKGVQGFDVENTPAEAWINQGNLWTFITLTRYPDGLTEPELKSPPPPYEVSAQDNNLYPPSIAINIDVIVG